MWFLFPETVALSSSIQLDLTDDEPAALIEKGLGTLWTSDVPGRTRNLTGRCL